MVTKISIASAIAMAAAITGQADTGSELRIYDGTILATANTAITTQVMLAAFPLATDPFQDPVDTVGGAVATGNAVAAQDAVASGVATWGAVVNSIGDILWIGDVSNPAGAGAIKISSTTVTSGIEISVISLSYTQPKA